MVIFLYEGWQWAERVIDTASQFSEGVELVFTPSPGRVLRYRVRLHQPTSFSTRSLGRNLSFSKADSKLSFATLPRHANGVKGNTCMYLLKELCIYLGNTQNLI